MTESLFKNESLSTNINSIIYFINAKNLSLYSIPKHYKMNKMFVLGK